MKQERSRYDSRSAAARRAVLLSAALAVPLGGCSGDEIDLEEHVGVAEEGVTCVTIVDQGPITTLVEDAQIVTDPSDPTKALTAYGAVTMLNTGYVGAGYRRSLFRFNLAGAGVPAGATITSATVNVRMSQSLGKNPIDVYAASALWSEPTVTWSQMAAAPGGGLGALATSVATSGIVNGSVLSFALAPALVATWLSPEANYGIIVDHPLAGRTSFGSSEAQAPSRPSMQVCYNPASCSDGIQNQGEVGVDCEGPCPDACVAVDPACVANGCLRDVIHTGDYTQAQLAALVSPGVTLENGYSLYSIRFETNGRESLATVAVPYGVAAPAGGFHVVSNNHGTTGVGDVCATYGTSSGAGQAGLFGARGLIGVAPDYPGLGTAGPHPYLVEDVEAKGALDAVRAALNLARYIGVPASGRAALVGLSQGGHATLGAAAQHGTYAPELDLRAFAASGPASGWLAHWQPGLYVSGTHLVYHALLAYAWSDYHGYNGPSIWAPALQPNVTSIFEQRCAFPPNPATPTIQSVLSTQPSGVFASGFLNAWKTGNWTGYEAFGTGFAENAIGPYAQTAPLRIYQGTADDTVLPSWTDALVASLQAGGVAVDYQVVQGAGHTGIAFGYLAYPELRTEDALAWLRTALAAP